MTSAIIVLLFAQAALALQLPIKPHQAALGSASAAAFLPQAAVAYTHTADVSCMGSESCGAVALPMELPLAALAVVGVVGLVGLCAAIPRSHDL